MLNRLGFAVRPPRRLIWIAAPLILILSTALLAPLLLHTRPAHAGKTNTVSTLGAFPGQWSKGADLPYAIGSLSLGLLKMTLLPNGKVLGTIQGGLSQVTTDTPLLYDPQTNTWSTTSSLGESIGGQTTTVLPNGKVLLAGGYTYCPADYQACATTIAKLYNPSTDTWAAVPSMPHPHADHAAVLLPNGKVAIIGGDDSDISTPRVIASVDVYDPATNAWETAHDLPTPRFSHTALLLHNGRVLVLGGAVPAGFPTASVGCGVSNCSSSPVASRRPAQLAASFIPEQPLMPFCGINGCSFATNSVVIYNPASDSWSNAASLPELRFDYTATVLPTGELLLAGGQTLLPSGMLSVPLSTTLLYDPTHDGWASGPAMHSTRMGHTATLLTTGQVLIAGGFGTAQVNGTPADLASTEIYDPATNIWLTGPPMIHTHSYAGATALATGQVFVAGFSLTNVTATSTGSPTASAQSQVRTHSTTGPTPGTDILTTVPAVPGNVHATAGNGAATVSWSAPLSGGSPITSYTITVSPGGSTKTVSGSAISAAVTGLTNGTRYTFTVTATNALGDGQPSAPSNGVTPSAPQTAIPTPILTSGGGNTVGGSGNTPRSSTPTSTPTDIPTVAAQPTPTVTVPVSTAVPAISSSPSYLLIGGGVLAVLVLLGIAGAIILSRRAQRP